MNTRIHKMLEVIAALTFAASGLVVAQDSQVKNVGGYPSKPVTIVVPYPAGGLPDGIARHLAAVLPKRLGQPIIVENISGGGTIGTNRVATSVADGHTLLIATVSDVVLGPLTNSAVKYKPTDLSPIAKISSSSGLLVGRANLAAKDIDDLVLLAKRTPGGLSYGSQGPGTFQYILGESIRQSAGIELLHVSYRGAAPIVVDLLGGQIDIAMVSTATALPYIKDGRLKSYGFVRSAPDPAAPELGTVNQGLYVKGIDFEVWIGLFFPKGVPDQAMHAMSSAIKDILREPETKNMLSKMGQRLPSEREQADFPNEVARDEMRYRSNLPR